MIITINCENEHISFVNQKMDVSHLGIYRITGPNGSGKTTIIRQIVEGNLSAIEFDDTNRRDAYEKNRENLISYVPQDIISYSCRVKDYCMKNMKNADAERLHELMRELKAFDIPLDSDFNNLSGGEKRKIAIISALLKNTPYLILDEPTNDLDEETITCLCLFLEKYSKTHTVIVVTHDDRLKFDLCAEFLVDQGEIHCLNDSLQDVNISSMSIVSPNDTKILGQMMLKKQRFFVWGILLVLVVLLFVLNRYICTQTISGKEPIRDGWIVVYDVDHVYSDLNKLYCEAEKIKVSQDDYFTLMSYGDIFNMACDKEIKNIVIADNRYIDRIFNELADGTNSIPLFVSQPSVLWCEYYDWSQYGGNEVLDDGRMPEDFQKEVVTSERILREFYEFHDEEIGNAIGQVITIDDCEYTIVGLTSFYGYIVSFDNEHDYGFYTYADDTYSEFMNEQIQYRDELQFDAEDKDTIRLCLVQTNNEKSVLQYLMTHYPANNYYSKQFSNVWRASFNRKPIIKLALFDILVCIAFGMLIVMIQKNVISITSMMAKDLDVFYLKKAKYTKVYYFTYCVDAIICVLGALIISLIFSNYAYSFVIIPIMLISSMAIMMPNIVYLLCKLKKVIGC